MGLPNYLHGLLQPLLLSKAVVGLTWSVLVLEFLLGIAIFNSSRFRLTLLPIALLFHAGIAFFMGITSFATAMLAALLLYLVPVGYSLGDTLSWYRKRLSNIESALVGVRDRSLEPPQDRASFGSKTAGVLNAVLNEEANA